MNLTRFAVAALFLAACFGGGGSSSDPDASNPFIDAGPDADIDAGGNCNPVSQTGCVASEKCALILDIPDIGRGHVGCVMDGTQAIGAACTEPTVAGGSDDCAAGGDCYRGTCMPICTTVNDQCADGSCVTFSDGGDPPIPVPIEICLPSCDLLAQDCGEGQGCYLAGEAVCVGAGDGAVGETCMFANGCLPGMVCVGSDEGGFVCRSFCGPWMDCFTKAGEVASCACGATLVCGPADICFAIGDGAGGVADDTAGVCIPATESDCDCLADPICPPAS